MNGTVKNWLLHGLCAIAIQMVCAFATGSLVYGAVVAFWGYWWKEAGEFSVRHWHAENRPFADFNPFHSLRTHDDRMDLAAVAVAVLIPLIIGSL